MSKLLILGAGASKACPYTRPHLPLPLLRELPSIFSGDRVNPEAQFHLSFANGVQRLLSATRGDIEGLLTTLYRLNEYFFRPEQEGPLDPRHIRRIFDSGSLPEFFDNAEDLRDATQVLKELELFSREGDTMQTAFGLTSFFNLFRGSIRDYFQTSIYRQPCPLHLRLFQMLKMHDCVVSFNYDYIADYALLAAGKLDLFSFEGLGFQSVNLPPGAPLIGPYGHVQFLKVHGSINWFNQDVGGIQRLSYSRNGGLRQSIEGGAEVHYYLDYAKPLPDAGNTPDPFLLPFHSKDLIYRAIPMFARHMNAFRYSLHQADEIWIVGKNFQNSDRELNGFIRYATSDRVRVLHVIDPAIDFGVTLFFERLQFCE